MHFTLVSPRLVIQKNDILGSGVPYWPIEIATLATFIKSNNDQVSFYDLFGSNPKLLEDRGDFFLQGESFDKYIEKAKITDVFIIFAISYMSHQEIVEIIKKIKKAFNSKKKIVVLENSQAVTAYSLYRVKKDFFDAGADNLICGEPYHNWHQIKKYINSEIIPKPENIVSSDSDNVPKRIIDKYAKYPVPAWDLVNLENYWSLPYSHGPKTKKFLPVLTSRGCPYPCDFCVVPETNNRRWRANSAEEVVSELLFLKKKYGVSDFQVEDLNPTVDHKRWEKICKILIKKNADIRFYFVSGTKAETVHIDTIKLFSEAGCRFISISPESGSQELMKIIGKKFDYDHCLKLVKECYKYGVSTQTCFIVGHPKETEKDFNMSESYLTKLVKAGLDEVAVFIVSPFAGSKLHQNNSIELDNPDAIITFSPKGRKGYENISRRRKKLLFIFFYYKITTHLLNFLKQCLRSVIGYPRTKMENTILRIVYIKYLIFINRHTSKSKNAR